ncbi:MAG TPA: glycosyltransferase family 4 protein [Candidatus Omnitrophota bacterium]|nr:glycosyltransferase family 4 protein [Candidatus Omnitrophota bacterium]
MKILMANKYFYLKGGSEYAFFDTVSLLNRHGHKTMFFSMIHPRNQKNEYDRYFVSNVDYERLGPAGRIAASMRIIYSFEARRKMAALLDQERPDVAHLHNIYHQISPAIIHSLKKMRVPIVMTLHDFKMVCPGYKLSLDGRQCGQCGQGRYHRCFVNACVKDSKAKSLIAAVEMYVHHNIMKIYDSVDVFIAPSVFLRDTLQNMGFRRKLVYLPNFIDVNAFTPHYGGDEDSVVYFGRLAAGKGLDTLIDAMFMLPKIKLKIIGEGEEQEQLMSRILSMRMKNVEFKGYLSGNALHDQIKRARCVVLPARQAENNPRSIIEAFALGKPVIATQAGGIAEMVKDRQTGLVCGSGDAMDLARKIALLMDNTALTHALGMNARKLAEGKYSAESHYQKLMDIYKDVTSRHG